MLGAVVGFGTGAAVLQLYIDLLTVPIIKITPSDTSWLGAWWAGFLIFALLKFLLSLPFFAFPKSLPTKVAPGANDNDDGEANSAYLDPTRSIGNHIKGGIFYSSYSVTLTHHSIKIMEVRTSG